MKPIINGLLIFVLIYLIADIFVTKHSLGLSFLEISNTLFGNEDEFLEPMSKSIFMEYVHAKIFYLMMIFLSISAVFARLFHKQRYMILSINVLMISGLLSIVSLSITYFMDASFIYTYMVSYYLWHIIALGISAASLWVLNFAKSV